MSTALIVGGDQIDGIKQVLTSQGITRINHWSGRKVGDSKKIIPHDTELIVMVTDWISHNFTHKIKQLAAKRGVRIVYTPNGPAALLSRLQRINREAATEAECSHQALTSARPSGVHPLLHLIRRCMPV